MKRHGGLWPAVVSWSNLLLAARKARRGKRDRAAVLRFEFDLEREILALQRELVSGDYRPGPFRTHWIDRPKRRMISAAPYRDRVVHHAVMNVLEPILNRRMHPQSYACRPGKGAHAAADRLQKLAGRFRYAVHCDVRKFFPSIDHALLKAIFRRTIKDRRLLALMDAVVDASNPQERVQDWFPGDRLFSPLERRRGLPIGNLTSQWFANWYLDGLDRRLTGELRIGGYVRYCDDFAMLDDDPGRLRRAVAAAREALAERRLRLHEERTAVGRTARGLSFVGFRIWPTHRLLRKAGVRRFRRRVRWLRGAYARGALGPREVRMRLNGWLGHACQACSRRLIHRLSREWVFIREAGSGAPEGSMTTVSEGERGGAESAVRGSGRVLDQQSQELPFCLPQQERAR